MKNVILQSLAALLAATAVIGFATTTTAQLVPGTGQKLTQVGDDFEDEDWRWNPNWPKSSKNLNSFTGGYGGQSQNGRWYEGIKRGQPDVVRRVPTPKGGLPGSKGSMLLRSLYTGIPQRPSYQLQQDDFIADVHYSIGTIPVAQSPSVVVRVFMPPVDQWEDRSGPTFAFRVACTTTVRERPRGLFSTAGYKTETYWPGMFVEFDSKTDNGRDYDSASLRVRGNSYGQDYEGPPIKQTGWWTMGLSCTPDGRVHYYAHPGLEPLSQDDHIASEYPYGYRAERFKTFFFNVCNGDDGKTWSTPWIVDDAEVFVATSS